MARYRVTVDTGGTFSDFVYLDEETREYRTVTILTKGEPERTKSKAPTESSTESPS